MAKDLNLVTVGKFAEDNIPPGNGAIIFFDPNTYHYNLGLRNVTDGTEELFRPHKESGMRFAQLSDDAFGFVPVMGYYKNPDPVKRAMEAINNEAERSGVKILSMGTGAELYSIGMMAGGVFDVPVEKREAYVQMLRNYVDIAGEMGIPLINGHRVATINPDRFLDTTMEGLAKKVKEAMHFDLDLCGIDSETIITGTEAINIMLGLELQRHRDDVSSTTELMYQRGMEPITVEQYERMARIIGKNATPPVWLHMDTGHVVVGGSGKKPEDFGLMEYAKVQGPRETIHYCSLKENKHLMPTKRNIEEDVRIKIEAKSTEKTPHPERYCSVLDYLENVAWRRYILEVSCEPKDVHDLGKLSMETAEVWEMIKNRFFETHEAHPNYNGLLVPKDYMNRFRAEFG